MACVSSSAPSGLRSLWLTIMTHCKRRDQLHLLYLESVRKIELSGSKVTDKGSAEWKDATRQARADSKAALVALNRHRKEHGC